jgi:hypothetical protein
MTVTAPTRLAVLCLLTTVLLLAAAARAATPALASTQSDAAVARIPALFKNCDAVHRRYPHGVGKLGARDHVAAGAEPVTSFKRSTRLYNLAMRYNLGSTATTTESPARSCEASLEERGSTLHARWPPMSNSPASSVRTGRPELGKLADRTHTSWSRPPASPGRSSGSG